LLSPWLLGLVVAASTTGTALVPRTAIPIAPVTGRAVVDVAWESPDVVLLATGKGVLRYSLRTRAAEPLVSTLPLPDGLPDPEIVSSDGASVVTTSHFSVGGYAMRLADRKRLAAMRVDLLPLDAAVRGQRACILALRMSAETDEAVLCGPVAKSWQKYQAVHRLGANGPKRFRQAFSFSRAGAIALAEDGSLFAITTAEPGLYKYAPDGKLIEKSGESFDELVQVLTREIGAPFLADVEGRYRRLLNTQPILEDLVLTPRGPALVVRIAEKERVRWELWWPRADGRIIPPTRLGIDRIGPYGHLQCDARGTSLVCVGAFPDKKKAADFRVSEDAPHLWIFELPK
jgi:hypothetical protein